MKHGPIVSAGNIENFRPAPGPSLRPNFGIARSLQSAEHLRPEISCFRPRAPNKVPACDKLACGTGWHSSRQTRTRFPCETRLLRAEPQARNHSIRTQACVFCRTNPITRNSPVFNARSLHMSRTGYACGHSNPSMCFYQTNPITRNSPVFNVRSLPMSRTGFACGHSNPSMCFYRTNPITRNSPVFNSRSSPVSRTGCACGHSNPCMCFYRTNPIPRNSPVFNAAIFRFVKMQNKPRPGADPIGVFTSPPPSLCLPAPPSVP